MKKVKIINVFSLLFNLLIVGGVVYATLLLLEIAELSNSILFFTTISNFLVAAFALLMIPFNIYSIVKGKKLPKAVVTLKQMGTVCMAITFVVVLAVLGPAMNLELPALLGYFDIQNYNFYYHLIVPVLAIVSSLFFDYSKPRKWAVTFIGVIPGLLYLAFYIVNVFLQIIPAAIPEIDKVGYDWYEFFSLFEGNLLWTILLFVGMAVGAYLLSFLIWLINNLITKKFAKLPAVAAAKSEPDVNEEIEIVEDEKEEEPEPESEPEPEPAPAPVEEPVEEEKPAPAPKKAAPKKAEPKAEPKKEEKKPVVKKAEPKPVEEKKPAPAVKKAEPSKKEEEKPAPAPKKAEPAKKEAPKAEPKAKAAPKKAEPVKKEAPKAEPAKKAEAKPAAKEAPSKVYHLTKRKEDGMWAITFVGGQKAVKLFKTKKEAEEHLKVLTENQGATALIRNSKGAKAGKFASSIKAGE